MTWRCTCTTPVGTAIANVVAGLEGRYSHIRRLYRWWAAVLTHPVPQAMQHPKTSFTVLEAMGWIHGSRSGRKPLKPVLPSQRPRPRFARTNAPSLPRQHRQPSPAAPDAERLPQGCRGLDKVERSFLVGNDPLVIGRKRGDLCSTTRSSAPPTLRSWRVMTAGTSKTSAARTARWSMVVSSGNRPCGQAQRYPLDLHDLFFVGLDDPAAEGPSTSSNRGATEIAWLLDEELVELKGDQDRTSQPRRTSSTKTSDCRPAFGPRGVCRRLRCRQGLRFTRGNVSIGRKQVKYHLPIWRPHGDMPSLRSLVAR